MRAPVQDVTLRTRIVEGPGTLARLGDEARALGRRALVVTDAGLVRSGHVDRAEAILRAAGLEVERFDATRENPTTEDAAACADAARAFAPELLVGLGGGSSIDVAKGANFLWRGGGALVDYRGRGQGELDLVPLVAVPTTAGTGSEVQSFALIVDAMTQRKLACGHPAAAPRVALLDPELTLSMPRFVTACTGLDAVGHAVEVAVSRRGNDAARAFAKEAFVLAVQALPRVLEAPGDVEARGAMLRAAALAGRGIENGMLGAAHSMANPLTARFGVSHGQAVATALPLVVAYNAEEPAAAASYARLAAAAGLVGEHTPTEAAVLALLGTLEGLLDAAGFPRGLAAHGVGHRHCGHLAREAAEQWTAQFNPRAVGVEDFTALFRQGVDR